MANLKIQSDVANCDVKLEVIHGEGRKVNGKDIKMSEDGRPALTYKDPQGTELVKFAEKDRNGVLIANPWVLIKDAKTGKETPEKGKSQWYVSKSGGEFKKDECQAFYETEDGELIPAVKNEKTEVFEVRTWDTLENYNNKYQMDKYYQVSPSSGVSKKDFDKALTIQSNTVEMKKLFEYMDKNNVVGKGVLNITSAGYLPSVGYLRAIRIGKDKWTLEIAVFRETKPFEWTESIDFKPTLSESGRAKAKSKSSAQVDEL